MTKLKIALAAALAVSSIAVIPATASAQPGWERHHGRERHHERVEHRREGRWERHHGFRGPHHVRRVEVCRNVRYHHRWVRSCRLETRRW